MNLVGLAFLLMMFSGSLVAQEIKIIGTITQSVRAPTAFSPTKNFVNTVTNTNKQIKLLKIELSTLAKKNFAAKAKIALSSTKQFATAGLSKKYPAKIELGMNNVPVMDQGMHGTCVTFAATAAVDAALNKGDYISQLCQLQLGNYLEKNAYTVSGWVGSWGRFVLHQMDVFGVVSKAQQRAQGCGGLSEYPLKDTTDSEGAITIEDYYQLSETLEEQVLWTPILDIYRAMTDRVDNNKTLNDVKAALNAGDRVTFGVLLLSVDLGFVGAVGNNKVEGDSWVLTPEVISGVFSQDYAAHEMVITGYDDNAVGVDAQGGKHRGLLTLRNSWGKKVGDQGNFYMSYNYFKLLVLEAQRIRSLAA